MTIQEGYLYALTRETRPIIRIYTPKPNGRTAYKKHLDKGKILPVDRELADSANYDPSKLDLWKFSSDPWFDLGRVNLKFVHAINEPEDRQNPDELDITKEICWWAFQNE